MILGGIEHDIDLRKDGYKFSAHNEKNLDLSAWDRMVFLKNDRLFLVKKGMIGIINELNN